MCGIAGFNKRTERTLRMEPILLHLMEARGRDSWGATDGDFVYKDPNAISKTWEDLGLEPCLYHTRGASVGSVCEKNAHPFEYIGEQGRVVGVHNGHINNYHELRVKYSRSCEVDSEHIFMHLAEGRDLKEIFGWGTVVWFHEAPGRPRTLNFSRFGAGQLSVCKLPTGEIVWASTREAIELAMRYSGISEAVFYKTEDNHRYHIEERAEGAVFLDAGKFEWGGTPPPIIYAGVGRTVHTTHFPGHQQRGGSSIFFCNAGHCNRIVAKDEFWCHTCLSRKANAFGIDKSLIKGLRPAVVVC